MLIEFLHFLLRFFDKSKQWCHHEPDQMLKFHLFPSICEQNVHKASYVYQDFVHLGIGDLNYDY